MGTAPCWTPRIANCFQNGGGGQSAAAQYPYFSPFRKFNSQSAGGGGGGWGQQHGKCIKGTIHCSGLGGRTRRLVQKASAKAHGYPTVVVWWSPAFHRLCLIGDATKHRLQQIEGGEGQGHPLEGVMGLGAEKVFGLKWTFVGT